ncbi:glycosyl transferase [Rhodoblastus sphagnicola]|uniref:Glycosyl transferase n=1 Tax=Rhodoblastus sphagnicola TaxID=333368 RepID=A0A2S6ND05_9HYPH|nr:glycosyltransferase family 2 protein [Rhodoblastus sphagnicola]MBB4198057.1 dolichol-phosphate mannosyltransferase [Rhodoblastus sphagnicola]PPQ32515.1 glycosyl transferase [Rhodoblastus sphagnicola]
MDEIVTSEGRPSSEPADPATCLLSVVVPVYKEEGSIPDFLARIVPVLEPLGPYEIIFALDPSPDRTEAVIAEAMRANPRIKGLVFSRRFGQPAATLGGILNASGDWVVAIDVDLQDPPELIPDLLAKARRDSLDVVTARRRSRVGETLVKRIVAGVGYAVINRISDVPIPANTGDFRIMSRRVVEELRNLRESHGFLRGLVSFVGFPQGELEYDRDARAVGAGNYNRHLGSIRIGFNGLFGFSTVPLQMMIWVGFALAILSVFGIGVVVALKILNGPAYPIGLPTLTVLVLFLGGVQLVGAGVTGEYIGRIYEEVRSRPQYIVDRALGVDVRSPRGR